MLPTATEQPVVLTAAQARAVVRALDYFLKTEHPLKWGFHAHEDETCEGWLPIEQSVLDEAVEVLHAAQ